MRTKIRVTAMLIASSVALCGCGDVYFPNLTEEETALITEYAVDVVVRHSRGTDYRLMDNAEEQLRIKREKQAAAEALRKEREAEQAAKGAEQEKKDGSGGSGAAEAPAMPVAASVNELLGINDLSIQWMGYEVMSSYAESSGFSMEATPGKALLVLSFYTENLSGEPVYLDIPSAGPVFRVGINDQSPKVVQTTMLLNDLSFFRGELAPGVSNELVLVQEIPEADAGNVQSVRLTGEVGGVEYDLGSR